MLSSKYQGLHTMYKDFEPVPPASDEHDACTAMQAKLACNLAPRFAVLRLGSKTKNWSVGVRGPV